MWASRHTCRGRTVSADATRAEAVLRESEARFRSLVVASAQVVWTADAAGLAVDDSPSWRAFTGQTFEQLKGWGWLDALHPDDRERMAETWARTVAERAPIEVEYRVRRPDRSYSWTVMRAAPVFNDDGSVREWVGTNTDITDRKQVEETLRESEGRFHDMADNAPAMMWVTDAEDNCVYVNVRWYEFTGQTPAAGLGFGWLDALHPDDRDYAHDTFVTASERREAFRLDYRLRRYDGEYRWVIAAGARRVGPDGTFLGYIGSVIDITERKQVEAEREALLAGAQQARAEAEAALVSLGRVQAITEAALVDLPLDRFLHELLARVREALQTDTAVILLREADATLRVRAASGVEEDLDERLPFGQGFAGLVAQQGCPVVWDAVDSGRVLPSLRRKGIRALAGVPLRTKDGFLGVLQVGSVSPRKFVEDEVHLLQLAAERVALGIERTARQDAERRAREQAEAAGRAKDEFLAMLGHELRNPLSAVRNALVSARLFPALQERALGIARQQTDQLCRLIDDLLDVARITQGKIALQRQRVRFAGVVERAVETTRQLVEARAHHLVLSLSDTDLEIDADATRLEQIVVNLVSNAAKYTEPGGEITVAVRREDGGALLRVRDNGVGIAPGMLPLVFDLFAQGDRALDRVGGGLGIGLTVVRRLVELHGGRVEARSEGLGKGAEFRVWFPDPPPSHAPLASVPVTTGVRQRQTRVLLVEDNEMVATSLVMLLEGIGYHVRAVHDGAAALDAAHLDVPGVMLIDIGLPGMDGYEVARRIREDPSLRRTVLVALTGYGSSEDKQRAMAAGFDYHLVKPVDPEVLDGILAS